MSVGNMMMANECGRVQRKAVASTRDHVRAKPDVCGSSVWGLHLYLPSEAQNFDVAPY